jgi:uncharacterized membrane protein YgdD (TMEM256/DUF423 family)
LTASPVLRLRLAALSGFLAVLLGAFGAHGMRDTLALLGTAGIWSTASIYHLAHSVVLLFLAKRQSGNAAFALMLAGIVGFSGGLYGYAATGYKPLTFIAPVGGACLLLGWLALLIRADRD